ncbi:hypothetical protein RyT2_14000 [Pseudolactococcus yaeyamensis]
MKTKYTKAEIAYLDTSNIVSVASSMGIEFYEGVDSKGFCRVKGHSKLAINPEQNIFYNFETRKVGKPINLLMDWSGMTFIEAVTYLDENDFGKTDHKPVANFKPKKKEPFYYYFKLNKDTTVARNYLVNERKLNANLVDAMLKTRMITQDVQNNVLFNYKWDNRATGAVVQGTTFLPSRFNGRDYFKGIARNSEPNFGFHFSFGNPQKIYIFEAPIDALSYYSFNPEARQDVMYAAMAGVKPVAVGNFIKYAAEHGQKDVTNDGIYISTDNDSTGVKFWSHYAKLNAWSEGPDIFKNNIPDFYSVPQDILDMYQRVLAEHDETFDLRPLLAIHKFETNFSHEPRISNDMGYYHYFALKNPYDPTTKEKIILSSDEIEKQVRSLVISYLDNDKDLRRTISHPKLSRDISDYFFDITSDLVVDYQTRIVAKPRKAIQKDWNDVLKAESRQMPVFIDVTNAHEFEQVSRNFDENQISKSDTKKFSVAHPEGELEI